MTAKKPSLSEKDISPSTMVIFHLGDGIIVGAVFYFLVAFVLFIFSDFFNRIISQNRLLFLVIFLLFVIIGARYILATILRNQSYLEQLEHWKNSRNWSWLTAVILPVAGILFGITYFLGGWKILVTLIIPTFLMSIFVVIGFILRIFGWKKSSTNMGNMSK